MMVEHRQAAHDKEVPCVLEVSEKGGVQGVVGIQVRIFFSSGAAQTNGGGSFCIVTYSLVSCRAPVSAMSEDS
jgi:hypothetical protein